MIRPDMLGCTAEYAVASDLLARGIVPNWPSVEHKPYDFIAATENHMYRVQVKGCGHKGPKVRVHCAMRAGKGRSRAYTSADIDFVVIRLFEFELSYVIPVKHIKKDLVIRPADPACRWHRFKEAWSLIK